MQPETDQLLDIFRSIKEPDTGKDILSLQMVRDLKIDQKSINFSIHLPSAKYPHKDVLYSSLYETLKKEFPDYEPNAHFIAYQPHSEAPNTVVPQIKNFIAVASGKGGVGKSTISANLAISLAKLGFKAGILDTDLYGPSMPTIFGIKNKRPQVVQKDGKNLLVPIDANGIPVISLGNIIEPEQAVVLRGPRLGAIIKQFFLDTVWPELDYLIIDLPPGTGDIQLTLVQTIPITGVVLVTTPQEVAVVDAIKAANMFMLDQISVPILGVIENMSYFSPPDMQDKKYYIFGKGGGQRLSDFTKSVILGKIPIHESIRQRADHELSIFDQDESSVEFGQIADKLVERVKQRNQTNTPTKIVQLTQ